MHVDQDESHSADNKLTEQQLKQIESNKAEALRGAARAEEKGEPNQTYARLIRR